MTILAKQCSSSQKQIWSRLYYAICWPVHACPTHLRRVISVKPVHNVNYSASQADDPITDNNRVINSPARAVKYEKSTDPALNDLDSERQEEPDYYRKLDDERGGAYHARNEQRKIFEDWPACHEW